MESKFKLTTPVLYLVFNRLNNVKITFREIQKAKPEKLFIACDGPRNFEEKKKTDAVRKYILENIDWTCKVKTLFRAKNLGCKKAVSSAIDWFFENVGEGIILEDDCLPNRSFFMFCQELLTKYRDNPQVFNIEGYNIVNKTNISESYLFSKYFFCWGWATWRRAWQKMNLEMEGYPLNDKKELNALLPGFFEKILLDKRFRDNIKGVIRSWAMSFLYTQLHFKALTIVSKENLIQNIGFSNISSTNTKENRWDKLFLAHEARTIDWPLIHPKRIVRNKKFEQKFIRNDLSRVILKKLF